ncbi:hypothetical protein GF389_02570, partial [Candidatus Dojkabacteria bacterium]|nr:hypothetical protein [Candidatus Dojkabacteria bacterium]
MLKRNYTRMVSVFFVFYFLLSPILPIFSLMQPAYAAEPDTYTDNFQQLELPETEDTLETIVKPAAEIEILDIQSVADHNPESDTLKIEIETSAGTEVVQIKYSEDELELPDMEWTAFDVDFSIDLPEARAYSFYMQIEDENGDVNDIPYLFEFERIGEGPTGTIEIDQGEIEARDTTLEIDFSGIRDTSEIAGYKYSLDEAELASLDYTSLFDPATLIEVEIPDETAEYTVHSQFIDEWGNESVIISDSINYTYFDIQPQITAEAIDPLFGGEFLYEVEFSNTGTDDGYNGLIEVVLPEGFSFVEETVSEEYNDAVDEAAIAPTFIDTNDEGEQVLKYQSIADLLAGESIEIAMILQAGGETDGYAIGDTVGIDLKGSLFKRSDWTVGFSNELTHEFELLPYVAEVTEHHEEIVGEEQHNEIEITNNPEQDSYIDESESNPAVVRFELENGMEYVEGSEHLENYDGDYTFNVIDAVEGVSGVILEWIFGDGFGTENYDNPISIFFDTVLGKNKEEDEIFGDTPVEHGETLENNLEIGADYQTGYELDEDGELIEIIQNFTQEEKQRIIAKYFTISKTGTPSVSDIGAEIDYTLNIKVSQYYQLTGITITDTLADGLSYVDSSASDAPYSITTNPETGETEIVWRLVEIEPGGEYEITYKALLNQEYETLGDIDQRLLSNDYLKNDVTIDAIWDDIEVAGRSGEGEDSSGDVVRTNRPVITAETKLAESVDWQDEIDVRVGDIADVRTNVEFPADVPTDEFNYKIYFPVGTQVVDGTINVVSTITSDNSSTDYNEITGGIEFNFGKVEPVGTWTLTYQLEVQDDPNLKLATVTRNLFRADYLNISESKFTHRDEITLNLIDPRLQVSKRRIDGYLASGEEAVVEVQILNTGTSGAYDLDILEYIPANSTLIETGEIFSVCPVTFNDIEQRYEVVDCDLEAGEEVRYYYRIEGNSGLVTG